LKLGNSLYRGFTASDSTASSVWTYSKDGTERKKRITGFELKEKKRIIGFELKVTHKGETIMNKQCTVSFDRNQRCRSDQKPCCKNPSKGSG
jgi:hypothetical protein